MTQPLPYMLIVIFAYGFKGVSITLAISLAGFAIIKVKSSEMDMIFLELPKRFIMERGILKPTLT